MEQNKFPNRNLDILQCQIILKKKYPNNINKKEDNWNNRFFVNQIQSQERLTVANQDEEFTPQSMSKYGLGHLKQKPGQSNPTSFLGSEKENLTKSFSNLKELWIKLNIPIHHRNVFIQCLKAVPKSKAFSAISLEIDDLQNNKAYIQNCQVAILTRENCLAMLNQSVDKLSEGELELQNGIQKCSELITHLRILTINVVEQIVAWRQYLQGLLLHIHSQSSILIPFMFNEDNYILKIKRDTSHLAFSAISSQFTFSHRSDPFFLALTNTQEQSGKIVQFTSKPLIKRIKVCEQILMDESTMDTNQEKSVIKNKGRQVERRQILIQPGKIRNTRDASKYLAEPSVKKIIQNPTQNNAAQGPEANNNLQRKVRNFSQQSAQEPAATISSPVISISNKAIQLSQEDNKQAIKIEPILILDNNEKEQQKESFQTQWDINNYPFDKDNILFYINKIVDAYKNTFTSDFDQIEKLYTQGMDSFFLAIRDSNQSMVGLAFFYLDKQCFNERRFYLSHFSVLQAIHFSSILEQVLRYFWENDPASELRMSLYHYQQDEYYGANKEITNQLKEIGFKWKIVQQVNPNVRLTVMALRRPACTNIIQVVEPIFLQNIVAVNNVLVNDKHNSFTSPVVTAYLLSKLTNFESQQLSQELQAKEDLITKGFNFPGIKFDSQTQDNLNNYLIKNYETEDNSLDKFMISVTDKTSEIQYAFLKACYRWKHCKVATLEENEYLYTRLQNVYNYFINQFDQDPEQCHVFQLTSKGTIVYLISTDDPTINIFVYETQDIIPQEEFLQSVQGTLQDLENQIPIVQNLFLPQFIVNTQINHKWEGQDKYLLQMGRFSTHYAPKLNLPGHFKSSDGIILKPPYVFGVLNSDVSDLVNLPYLAFIVTDQDCIKKGRN